MNAIEFNTELRKINEQAWNAARELVQRAQKEEGLPWDTDQPLPFHDDPNMETIADGIAELGGWIRDRLNGINRLHKKSITKRIRKALGYTYP